MSRKISVFCNGCVGPTMDTTFEQTTYTTPEGEGRSYLKEVPNPKVLVLWPVPESTDEQVQAEMASAGWSYTEDAGDLCPACTQYEDARAKENEEVEFDAGAIDQGTASDLSGIKFPR